MTESKSKSQSKGKSSNSQKTTNNSKKTTKWVLIALAGFLGLCACGGIAFGVYWFFFRGSTGPIYTEEPIVNILEPSGSNWYATDEESLSLSGIAFDE